MQDTFENSAHARKFGNYSKLIPESDAEFVFLVSSLDRFLELFANRLQDTITAVLSEPVDDPDSDSETTDIREKAS